MSNLVEEFRKARAVSSPLVCICTPDPSILIQNLMSTINNHETLPIFKWDSVNGLSGITPPGKDTLWSIFSNTQEGELVPPEATRELVVALRIATQFPTRSILFLLNANQWIRDPVVAQGVWNLRNPYRAKASTLVLLGPNFTLPVELEQDVSVLDDPLPTDEQYRELLLSQFKMARDISAGDLPEDPNKLTQSKAIEALRGLAIFPAEESIAKSLSKEGIDINTLWDRKCRVVENTRGLEIRTTGETFNDVGGLGNFKDFMTRLFNPTSPAPISLIVFLDELEKALGGSHGPSADNTGVSQDFLGVLLKTMEDENWRGLISVGVSGSGKSLCAKAVGNTFGVPTVRLDLGDMKGGIVGESEGNIRQAMKVLKGIGGGGCFFIATANKLESVPVELKRRFRYGTWFFDLPTTEERDTIWTINLSRYGLDKTQPKPPDNDWVGSDIRACCELSWSMSIPIEEAGRDIIPVAHQDREVIERLRVSANGRWHSTSHSGPYRLDSAGDLLAHNQRKIEL